MLLRIRYFPSTVRGSANVSGLERWLDHQACVSRYLLSVYKKTQISDLSPTFKSVPIR